MRHQTDTTPLEVYLIRHCKAAGQAEDAPLTADGFEQSEKLAVFLGPLGIRKIVSSPFLRARQSISPLSERIGVTIDVDHRLAERVLADGPLPDWMEQLRASFEDLDRCLPGGESSRTAMNRGVGAITDVIAHSESPIAVVSHGNLLTLLLTHFDGNFGFDDWRQMTNPDVFRLSIGDNVTKVERLWGLAVQSADRLT